MTRWNKVRQRAKELRTEQTIAEKVLWNRLRNRGLNGLKFRRQHPLGPFIANFYCVRHRLIVEVDGGIHEKQEEQDCQRDSQLTAYGYRVLRIKNQEVESDLETVLGRIAAACSTSALLPGSLGEGQAGGCPDESRVATKDTDDRLPG